MAGDDETGTCDFCKKGRVEIRIEEMTFRQWSDKGYIHCRVTISMGTCDSCGSKLLDEGADEIFDAAFRREYDKLR